MRREILEFLCIPHPNYFNVVKPEEVSDDWLIIGDINNTPYVKTVIKHLVFKYEEIYDNGDSQVFCQFGYNDFKPINSYRNYKRGE